MEEQMYETLKFFLKKFDLKKIPAGKAGKSRAFPTKIKKYSDADKTAFQYFRRKNTQFLKQTEFPFWHCAETKTGNLIFDFRCKTRRLGEVVISPEKKILIYDGDYFTIGNSPKQTLPCSILWAEFVVFLMSFVKILKNVW